MNMKLFRALAELMKPVNKRSKELIGHLTSELIAPGDNELKRLMREGLEPVSLILSLEDKDKLKGLLCR